MELLRGFEAAARHLSFTRAGAELSLTQSAVSRQVRQLEEQLGVRLFDRRTRSLVLTDVGYRFHVELQRVLQQLQEATQRARTARTEHTIRVTTTPTFAALWLIPRLSAFRRRHPRIHVHVVAENVLRNLERDDFDVAVRYSERSDARHGALKLFGEQLLPLCSPAVASRCRLKRIEDLERASIIHFSDLEGYAPWLSWETWFSGMGVPSVRGRGALYFSHYDQAVRAALAGQGVVLGRLPVASELLESRRLVAPFGTRHAVALPGRSYWLLTSSKRSESPEVRAFADWLLRTASRPGRFAESSRIPR